MQHDGISCCLYTLTAVFDSGGRSVQMIAYLTTIQGNQLADNILRFFVVFLFFLS